MPRKRYRSIINPVASNWVNIEFRLELFFGFWQAVKDNYSGIWQEAIEQAARGEQAQLFRKVSLLTLQQFILDSFVRALPFRNGDPPLSSKETVTEMVSAALRNLPGEFFTRQWQTSQMDTSEGKREFYEVMKQVSDNEGKNLGHVKLFRRTSR
jgi:hypothetical protein